MGTGRRARPALEPDGRRPPDAAGEPGRGGVDVGRHDRRDDDLGGAHAADRRTTADTKTVSPSVNQSDRPPSSRSATELDLGTGLDGAAELQLGPQGRPQVPASRQHLLDRRPVAAALFMCPSTSKSVKRIGHGRGSTSGRPGPDAGDARRPFVPRPRSRTRRGSPRAGAAGRPLPADVHPERRGVDALRRGSRRPTPAARPTGCRSPLQNVRNAQLLTQHRELPDLATMRRPPRPSRRPWRRRACRRSRRPAGSGPGRRAEGGRPGWRHRGARIGRARRPVPPAARRPALVGHDANVAAAATGGSGWFVRLTSRRKTVDAPR